MTLPVVDPPAERSGERRVVGVLLAAGTSTRFGDRNKLLAPVDDPGDCGTDGNRGQHDDDRNNQHDGDHNNQQDNDRDGRKPMVRRSASVLLDAGLDEVVVVVGFEADRVRDALGDLDVRFVENPDYEEGQASSVRAGVQALGNVDAAVFALGDMPYVNAESVRALVAAYETGTGSALAAGFDGERGNPVLFDARHFDALADSDGDTGGKRVLLSAEDAAVVETGDPGVRRDIDRPDEFA